MAQLGERGLINWILPRLRSRNRGRFLVPPGDDAAILTSPGKPVLSIDGLTDGVHFKLSWSKNVARYGFRLGRGLGWKLLGSSLSDLASMGDVRDRWAMIFVAAPRNLNTELLKDFFHGLLETASAHKCAMAGGDTVEGKSLTLVAAVGGTLASRPVLRSGSKPGDLIGIAGTVGDAARGLEILEGKNRHQTASARYFVRRFFDAVPLFGEGARLANSGVRSLMDLSDSLPESLDLMLPKEQYGFEVSLAEQPRSPSYRRAFGDAPEHISGGEDYSLLFTVPPARRGIFQKKNFRLIGRVTEPSAGRRYFNGAKLVRPTLPFEHFR